MAEEREPIITPDEFHAMAYGVGIKDVELDAFLEIRDDSDRSSGIVAGSIVELRLTEVIRARMRSDKADITKRLFNPDGALGAFGSKVDLAYMLGFVSDTTFIDLAAIVKIRNAFAHRFEVSRYDHPAVLDKCKSLRTVDLHAGPIEGRNESIPYLGFEDYDSLRQQPRFRYITTAQVICYRCGMAARAGDAAPPV